MRRSICEQWVEFCSKPLRHSIGEDLRRGEDVGWSSSTQLLTPAWSLVLCCCILEAEEEEEEEEEVEGE